MSSPTNEPTDFGELLDENELDDFATIDNNDIENALDWWDENASDDFIGVLE